MDVNTAAYWMDAVQVEEGLSATPYVKDGYVPQYPPDPAPVITVSTPNGGEGYGIGTVRAIEWTASGGTGTLIVDLEYSTTGASGPWKPVASGLPDTGIYNWTVPNTPSTNCYIRAKVTDSDKPLDNYTDTSDNAFTIGSGVPEPSGVAVSLAGFTVVVLAATAVAVWRRKGQQQGCA